MASLDTMIDLATLVGRKSTAVTAEVDGQLVALDVTQGVCFGLNRVATRIWQIVETPTPIGDIVTRLLAEYEVDRDTCVDQTEDLVRNLVHVGLATARPGA